MKDKSYCFDFGLLNKISIIAKYLYFNSYTLGLLNNPQEVMIGIDRENKAMLIKAVDERLCCKKYKVNRQKIYSDRIVNEIKKITDKTSFEVKLDREFGGLLVELGD